MTTQSEAKIPIGKFTDAVKDILSVRRVFGEAYERDGVTVIPVAKIWGGSGEGQAFGGMGGKGHAQFGKLGAKDDEADDGGVDPGLSGSGEASGSGGGLGVVARPAGVYVIDGDEVYWQPAVSVNQLAWVLGAVTAVGVATLPCLVRALRRKR